MWFVGWAIAAREESISVHDWRKIFLKPYCVVQTFPYKGPTSRFWTNGSKLLLKLFLIGLLLPLIWATSYWSLRPFELPGPALDWDILTPCPQVRFPRREISTPIDPAICWLNCVKLGIGLFKNSYLQAMQKTRDRNPICFDHRQREKNIFLLRSSSHIPIKQKFPRNPFDPFCFAELKFGILFVKLSGPQWVLSPKKESAWKWARYQTWRTRSHVPLHMFTYPVLKWTKPPCGLADILQGHLSQHQIAPCMIKGRHHFHTNFDVFRFRSISKGLIPKVLHCWRRPDIRVL